MQTKLQSHAEAALNTAVSFLIGVGVNMVVLPMMGFPAKTSDAVILTTLFIALSYVRQYFLRRFFNWVHAKQANWSVLMVPGSRQLVGSKTVWSQ